MRGEDFSRFLEEMKCCYNEILHDALYEWLERTGVIMIGKVFVYGDQNKNCRFSQEEIFILATEATKITCNNVIHRPVCHITWNFVVVEENLN